MKLIYLYKKTFISSEVYNTIIAHKNVGLKKRHLFNI